MLQKRCNELLFSAINDFFRFTHRLLNDQLSDIQTSFYSLSLVNPSQLNQHNYVFVFRVGKIAMTSGKFDLTVCYTNLLIKYNLYFIVVPTIVLFVLSGGLVTLVEINDVSLRIFQIFEIFI